MRQNDSTLAGDPAHAFYLGYEMYKAQLALQLGKNYVQDRPLAWGHLSSEPEQGPRPPSQGREGEEQRL
jgi:hypothetical protein